MSTAQIAVAVYGSGWAAWSAWRAWPDACRKIARDIWTGLHDAYRSAFPAQVTVATVERHQQHRQIRARLDEVHRMNEAAQITWNNAVSATPHAGGGGGAGKVNVYLVPGSERRTLEYEYRTVMDSRLTDEAGNYRTVTQRRLRDTPGAAWEDTGFGYCPPPRDDRSSHERLTDEHYSRDQLDGAW